MFAPTKTWRRWHRKIAVNQKRYAVASCLAASAIPALVMARGHRIAKVAEVPLVVDSKAFETIDKTKKAVALLRSVGALTDVLKVKESKKLRAGKGKMRDRRWRYRRGPLIIFNKQGPIMKAFRNIPGIEVMSVKALNLLQLAPGGHMGRFIIWTQDAFERLDKLYGTHKKPSAFVDYSLPRPLMTSGDLNRIINSDEIQSVLRPKQRRAPRRPLKKNPLKNLGAMVKLNPYTVVVRRREELAKLRRAKLKAAKAAGTLKPSKRPLPKGGKHVDEKRVRKQRANYYKQLLS
jgi:large subunit ribosomal protein L4e